MAISAISEFFPYKIGVCKNKTLLHLAITFWQRWLILIRINICITTRVAAVWLYLHSYRLVSSWITDLSYTWTIVAQNSTVRQCQPFERLQLQPPTSQLFHSRPFLHRRAGWPLLWWHHWTESYYVKYDTHQIWPLWHHKAGVSTQSQQVLCQCPSVRPTTLNKSAKLGKQRLSWVCPAIITWIWYPYIEHDDVHLFAVPILGRRSFKYRHRNTCNPVMGTWVITTPGPVSYLEIRCVHACRAISEPLVGCAHRGKERDSTGH